ncbi:MAG: CHRD domain-containing protein [Nitrososphaeraceae archaeon]|jgi:hypothetical protein
MSKNNIKHENVFAVFVIAAILAMAAISATAILPNGLLYAQEEDAQEFTAELSGEAEVPPVETEASGDATFELNSAGDQMTYTIDVENIDRVLYAHIHQGSSDENGDIVVTLFNPSSPTAEVSGELANGTITASSLEGPLQGKQMSDLIGLINNGTAYVNVHTEENPPGELRGTIEEGGS